MSAAILLNGGDLQRRPSTRSRARQGRPPRRWGRALAGTVLALGCALAHGEGTSWRDIESRIQYGYYTENALQLRNLSEAVAAGAAHDKLRGYYAGLLAWRLALLAAHNAAAAPGISATQMAQRCVSELDTALALEADFAEGLALRSACLVTPSGGGGIFAPVTGYRARRDLDRARELDAHNPRVLLVDAMSDYELAPAHGGSKERALGKLRQAVAAFESERREAEHLPGWGAAEAWLLLAQDLLDHGDPMAARDALEHALLIAPEYAQARRLMAKIASG
jgi:hypothetical protein